MSYLRGRRRRWTGEIPTYDPPHIATSDELGTAEVHADLIGAIRNLPPRQRAVIALRYPRLGRLWGVTVLSSSPA